MEPEDRPDRPPQPPAPPHERGSGQEPWQTGRRAAPGRDAAGDPEPSGGSDPSSGREPSAGPAGPPWLRRLRPRSARTAVGLGLLGAAVLLLPFLDDPDRWWIPVGLGFGALVLLYLLRLDRVLFGWAPHVAGVVLVAALVWATSANPWAWGLAAGVGVVLAGLLLLPQWRVLALGAAVLVVSGVGYQFRAAELAEQQARMDAQAGEQMRVVLGVTRPQLAIVGLDEGVRDNDPDRICRMLEDPAVEQVRAAVGAVDCRDAVARLHARAAAASVPATEIDRRADPEVAPGQQLPVDACSTLWAASAGPGLGRVQLIRADAPQKRFQVAGFAPC